MICIEKSVLCGKMCFVYKQVFFLYRTQKRSFEQKGV